MGNAACDGIGDTLTPLCMPYDSTDWILQIALSGFSKIIFSSYFIVKIQMVNVLFAILHYNTIYTNAYQYFYPWSICHFTPSCTLICNVDFCFFMSKVVTTQPLMLIYYLYFFVAHICSAGQTESVRLTSTTETSASIVD